MVQGMPTFSASLGCRATPFLYQNRSTNAIPIPLTTLTGHTELDLHGAAVGTIVLAQSRPDAKDIEMDFTLRAEDADLAQHVLLKLPQAVEDGVVASSYGVIYTPNAEYLDGRCMRFDIVLRLPPTLKTLVLRLYTPTQVLFDPSADIELEDLSITIWSDDNANLLLPHEGIRAERVSLETYGGWIVGDVSLMKHVNIFARMTTTTHVTVRPVPQVAGPAQLQTIVEHGRMDVEYAHPRGGPHRVISSKHGSQEMSNMYLTYKHSGFGGRIQVDATQASAEGVHGANEDSLEKWDELLWVGNRDGPDEVIVTSPAGWVGLYF